MGGSSPPPPPDPIETAGAQTAENVTTAIANNVMNKTTQTDPYGDTLSYNQTGTYQMTDPLTGAQYSLPEYTQNINLSPGQQQLYNTGEAVKQNMANTANTLSSQASNRLGTPLNLSPYEVSGSWGYLTPGQNNVNPDQFNVTPDQINQYTNTNWEQPFNDTWNQKQSQLNQQLADQGINVNSEAWNNAQRNFGQELQNSQDQYSSAMYGTAAQAALGTAGLNAQNNRAGNALNAQNLFTTTQNNFNNSLAAQQYNAGLQTQMYNEPLNELSALQSGSQISSPQFGSVPNQTIPTTDYANIANQSYQDQLAGYNIQQQNNSAMMGGLFGLGSAGILGGLSGGSAGFGGSLFGQMFA